MSQLESKSLHPAAHLNDDQFTGCAIGLEPDAIVSRHLAQCELCRNELAAFGSSVESFNRATQSWSESQPVPSLQAARATTCPLGAPSALRHRILGASRVFAVRCRDFDRNSPSR